MSDPLDPLNGKDPFDVILDEIEANPDKMQPKPTGKPAFQSLLAPKPDETDEKPSNEGDKEHDRDITLIKIDDELALLLRAAKDLVRDASNDSSIPLNQKAQAINSLGVQIDRIAKTRTEVFNSERMRRIEQAVIRFFKSLPPEEAEKFLELFNGELADV